MYEQQPTTVHQPTAGYDPDATVAYDPAAHGTTVYPNAAYGAPVTYAPPVADERSSHKGLAVIVGLVVALLFLGGGTLGFRALASSPSSVSASPAGGTAGGAAAPGRAGTTVAPAVTTTEAPVTTTAPASPAAPTAPAPKAPTGGGAPAPTNPPAPKAPQPPAAPKPAITSFTTPENIDCHNGNFQQFTASWTTTNATKVSISIDGPGVYKYYPANGSDSLPFSCDTPHSFLLTAYGADGSTVSTSITLQPRNVQMPQAPGADEE